MIRKRNTIRSVFVAISVSIVAIFGFQSCSSSRRAVAVDKPVAKVASLTDMRINASALISRYVEWERIRLPLTLDIASPKKLSISGTAIFDRNKSVLISLKFWGMEIGSLYVTNDSVTVVDKLHKCYASQHVADMLAGFDVNVSNVQDLLLGRLFRTGSERIAMTDCRNSEMELISDTSWLLIPDNSSDMVNYGFSFSPADMLNALIVQSGGHTPVTFLYKPAVTTTCGPFSPEVDVSYSIGKTLLDASIMWDFSKAKWNGEVELRAPGISNKYRRIQPSDIPQLISNL